MAAVPFFATATVEVKVTFIVSAIFTIFTAISARNWSLKNQIVAC